MPEVQEVQREHNYARKCNLVWTTGSVAAWSLMQHKCSRDTIHKSVHRCKCGATKKQSNSSTLIRRHTK